MVWDYWNVAFFRIYTFVRTYPDWPYTVLIGKTCIFELYMQELKKIVQSGGASDEIARYFDNRTNTGARKGNIFTPFLGQDHSGSRMKMFLSTSKF